MKQYYSFADGFFHQTVIVKGIPWSPRSAVRRVSIPLAEFKEGPENGLSRHHSERVTGRTEAIKNVSRQEAADRGERVGTLEVLKCCKPLFPVFGPSLPEEPSGLPRFCQRRE